MISRGIVLSICMHKILVEDDYKLVIQPQRRLNPTMKEVVRKGVKLLDADIICPILDSSWVSPIQVVPKKGGITMVAYENNELIPTRFVTGWLNREMRKHHFPLPFIDLMLEKIVGHAYYCFLDGYLGYYQIMVAPEDQKKTTFTCPYGIVFYRWMPFGLCNGLTIFQRCMLSIFFYLI